MRIFISMDTHKKEWQEFALVLKDLLDLKYSPVALSCQKEPFLESFDKKVRICRAILEAGKGESFQISQRTNACFGAAWHLGLYQLKDANVIKMLKKFVVEGEKLFCSYQALDKLIQQMGDIPDNSDSYFLLSPLEKCEFTPGLIIFICDANAACRLLTLAIFIDGIMPKVKIGGPTCRMAVMYPLLEREINLSFYDYTARKICNVPKDKLLVSVPYAKIPQMVNSIDKCSAGIAKIEYPQEFREFLKRMSKISSH
ncbi:MAG: DUF169 domain-containing protein [Candidatus Omnitrophota bacterium]|jgi:uncharacterized protein (DUF169 family)